MKRLALPVGYRSHMLVVLGDAGSNRFRRSRVLVRCDCGVEKTVSQDLVAAGRVASCGCWRRKRAAGLNLKHGEAREVGEGPSPEWRTWQGMIARCENSDWRFFKNYGGRGIKICERWRNSYEAFLADVGRRPSPKHSIDRINNDGNYEPGNVRWATDSEQARNKRTTTRLTIDGVTRTMSEWSEISGVRYGAIQRRISNGWDPRQAVFQPSRKRPR